MATDAPAAERRMIMTEFITRNYGNKEFEVIIKTDSEEHYKETQDFARKLIDHAKPQTNADRIRSMNDKELKKFICSMFKCEFCDFELGERCGLLNWLQMPAEDDE